MLQCTTRRTPASRRRLDDLAHGGRVDGAIVAGRDAGLPVNRGDVIDDVDVPERGCDGGLVADVAHRDVESGGSKIPGLVGFTHQHAHAVAASQQASRQVPPGEAGGAGYEDAHRSARTVTGEANTRETPRRRRIASVVSAKRGDQNSL